MENKIIQGSCNCQAVKYQISGKLRAFQYCHCTRCQKITGSAHSANIMVKPEQFSWITGEDNVA
ncbi:MAG: GFA family protein, partial [Sinobacterium sp.]|nr:GFA family protein [Sinobacterium sp.]